MSQRIPVLEGRWPIRTRPDMIVTTVASGADSETETETEIDPNEDADDAINKQLQKNQEYMDSLSDPNTISKSGWELEALDERTRDGTPIQLIVKPTASNLSHRLLNPYAYKNVKNIGTLHDLATLLDSPDDWEARYNNQIKSHGFVLQKMDYFRNLSEDTTESDIHIEFSGIVSSIALLLGIHNRAYSERKFIVGGLLARDEFDLRGSADPQFANLDGSILLASEAKTDRSFGLGHVWYQNSRGVQVLSTLYTSNAPTILFTQKQWKIFAENKDRNSILTFPFGDTESRSAHQLSCETARIGTEFLQAIVICLLSNRFQVTKQRGPIYCSQSSAIQATPPRGTIPLRPFTPAEKSSEATPTFKSGMIDGKPRYTVIRIRDYETVRKVENDLAMGRKPTYLND